MLDHCQAQLRLVFLIIQCELEALIIINVAAETVLRKQKLHG